MRIVALGALLLTTTACIREVKTPPTAGYGAPYQGTGKPIYLKDSRTDWAITEGGKPMTSEHALEATNDPEYETRRTIGKEYNAQLYADGQDRRTKGQILVVAGGVLAIAGFVGSAILPGVLRESTTTPATATDPEVRDTSAGGASIGVMYGGVAVGLVGIGMMVYGYLGGSKPPPYVAWRTPAALNRPAYIRERTEGYNEKIGVATVQEQPGAVENIPLAPGQRKAPPPRPTGPASPATSSVVPTAAAPASSAAALGAPASSAPASSPPSAKSAPAQGASSGRTQAGSAPSSPPSHHRPVRR
jgi:hypothetical protein